MLYALTLSCDLPEFSVTIAAGARYEDSLKSLRQFHHSLPESTVKELHRIFNLPREFKETVKLTEILSGFNSGLEGLTPGGVSQIAAIRVKHTDPHGCTQMQLTTCG